MHDYRHYNTGEPEKEPPRSPPGDTFMPALRKVFDEKMEAVRLNFAAVKALNGPLPPPSEFAPPSGPVAEAALLLKCAVSLDPLNGTARQNLAKVLLHAGDDDGAFYHFEKTVSLRPEFEESRVGAINILKKWKNHGEIIRLAEEGVDINPRSVLLWIALGQAFTETKKYGDALAAYDIARDIDLGPVLKKNKDGAHYAAAIKDVIERGAATAREGLRVQEVENWMASAFPPSRNAP